MHASSNPWIITAMAVALVLGLVGGAVALAHTAGSETSDAAFIKEAETWAFPKDQSPGPSAPNAVEPKPDPDEVIRIPGSARSYTYAQAGSYFLAPGWFPQDHPPMPHVGEGRKPAMACAVCHQPNGRGDPMQDVTAIEHMPLVFEDGVAYDTAAIFKSMQGRIGMN